VLGAAWMVGAVTALEQVHGLDVREFDELVGTSAGSVLASLLAAGVSIADLRTHQLGGRLTTGPLADLEWDHDTATGGERPPTPKVEFAVSGVLRKGFKHWRQLPPTAKISSFMPIGQGSIDRVGDLVRHVVPRGWVPRRGLTVVAFDIDSATRTAFGRPDAPPKELPPGMLRACLIGGILVVIATRLFWVSTQTPWATMLFAWFLSCATVGTIVWMYARLPRQ